MDVDAVMGEDPEVRCRSQGLHIWFAHVSRCVARTCSSPLLTLPRCALPWAAQQEVLINVAAKKPNWDLRRDIAPQLARLERRTQAAMIKLMQQEEQRRQAEEGEQA